MGTRNTIVAVGGTGTHVAISFLRLAILSNMEIKDVPNVIVVDADVVGATEESLTTIAKRLYDQVVAGVPERSRPLWAHFPPFKGGDAESQTVSSNTKFGDYLIGEPLENASLEQRQVLDALFTRKSTRKDQINSEKSEQEILIKDGFFARPSVGSTAIYDLLGLSDSQLARTLLTLAKSSGGYTGIAVVGSSTGGTGSGGAPAIAQWLQKEKENPARLATGARVALFMTLPWFFPEETLDPKNGRSYGSRETQRLNAAAGIRLYSESESLKEAAVFLADYNGIQTARNDDGNSGQTENQHPLPLTFATQIQNFFISAEKAVETNDLSAIQGVFTFFNLGDEAAHFQIDAIDSPLSAFSSSAVMRQDINQWAVETQSMRLILNVVATYLQNNYRLEVKDSFRAPPPVFRELMLKLAKSKLGDKGVEKDKNTGISILGLLQKDVEVSKIREELIRNIRVRTVELGESIQWLSQLVENSIASGKHTFNIPNQSIKFNLDAQDAALFPIFEKDKNPKPKANFIFQDAFDQTKTRLSFHRAEEAVRMFEQLSGEASGLSPDTAAVIVIERQIRSLMRIAQKDLISSRSADFSDVNLRGQSPVYLVPLKVNETPVNKFLARIDLNRLVDDALDREATNRKKFDPAHPFTITGLPPSSIPSPWAAAHLQSWHQLHGSEKQKKQAIQSFEAVMWGIFTKRLKQKTLDVKQTRLGRMLKNSLESELNSEASFSTGNLVVVVDANNEEDVVAANHPYAGWFLSPSLLEQVNVERVANWWRLPRFGFALPSEMTKNTLNPNDFGAREISGFCAMLEGLSAKHLIDANKSRDLPWFLAVKEIITVLQQAVSGISAVPFKEQQEHSMTLFGRDRTTAAYRFTSFAVPVLVRSLPEILKDYIPTQLISVKTSASGNFTPAQSGNEETLEVRHPDIPIFARYLGTVKNCSLLDATADESNSDKYNLRYQLEIQGLGLTTIECQSTATTLEAYLAIFPNYLAAGWQHYKFGCLAATTTQDEFRFSVFNEAGELLGSKARSFVTNHEIEGVPKYLSLIGDGSEDAAEISGECGCFDLKLSRLPDQNLAFRLGLDIGTSHSCFFPMENSQDGTAAIAGIDFSRCGPELTEVIFNDSSLALSVVGGTSFLGIHSAQPSEKNKLVIPSELKVLGGSRSVVNQKSLANPDHSKSFATLPYEYFSKLSSTRKGSKGEFLTDFKWGRDTISGSHHGLSDTEFKDQQPAILSVYLKHILMTGFAMLRKRGFKDMTTLRATYPEAFNGAQVDSFADTLAVVLNQVCKSTGVTVSTSNILSPEKLITGSLLAKFQSEKNQTGRLKLPGPNESCFVSESLAAVAASPGGNLGANVGVKLVLDMGGGTTDIALYAFGGNKDQLNSLESITDSIRYAGNDILQMLNTDSVFENISKAVDPNAVVEVFGNGSEGARGRMTLIKRLMRNPETMRSLASHLKEPAQQNIRLRVDSFFLGLTKYAVQLIKAYQPSFESAEKQQAWDIDIVLLGNGWKLTDLIYDNRRVTANGYLEGLKSTVERELGKDSTGTVKVKYDNNSNVGVKEAIAYGALAVDRVKSQLASVSTNKVITGVALKVFNGGEATLVGKSNLWEPKVVLNDLTDEYTIEVDLEKFDLLDALMLKRFGEMTGMSNSAIIKSNIGSRLNGEIAAFIESRKQSSNPLKISPYGLFLEQYWKNACLEGLESN
jgi:hypothetical protein